MLPEQTLERVETNLEMVEICDITGDLQRLESALEEALLGTRQLENADFLFRALLAGGRAADDAGRMAKAENYINEALSIAREMSNRRHEVAALYWLSILTAHQGRLHDASAYAVQALALTRPIDRVYEGKLLRAIGIQKSELEQPAEAIDWLEQSVQVFSAIGDKYDMLQSQLILSNLYYELGMWDQCFRTARELTGHFEASGARVKADNVRVNMIDVYLATGNPAAARQMIQEISDDGLAFGVRGVAIVKLNWGLILEAEGKDAEAVQYYLEAIKIAEASRAFDLIADTKHDLGRLLLSIGRSREAIPMLESARNFRLDEGYLLERLQSEAFLGLALLETGNRAGAEALALTAWQKFQDGVPIGIQYQGWLWALYRLMAGLDQIIRANEVLDAAYNELQRQARNISDPQLRRAFFEQVPLNSAIVAAYDKHTAAGRVISVSLAKADSPLGRPLEDDEFVVVNWTVAAPEDEAFAGKNERRKHRLLRLMREAGRQGAAPTDDDLASALGVSRRTILRDMRALADKLPATATRKRKKKSGGPTTPA